MADKKISALTASSTPLAGTEVLPIVQSGSTVQVSVANLTAGRVVSASGAAVNATFKAWSVVNAYQVGTGASFGGGVGFADGFATCNSYYDGSTWRRISATGASQVALTPASGIRFNIAGSGAADSTMSWTEVGSFSALTDFTVNTGNLVIGTAGKGIDFSANTNAAGMTSELLNWYETGTWTPNQGSGLTVVGTFSSAGRYTRIGNQVTITGSLSGSSSIALASPGIIFTNIPYAVAGPASGSMNSSSLTSSGTLTILSGTTVYGNTSPAVSSIYFAMTYLV